ncbi:MAG: sortase [Streptomyces sp.]|nr:sortase [Streptomyces sp.]
MKWPGRVLWGFGEAAVTLGVVVLLLVAHQLWWTNLRAHASAQRQVTRLEQQWDGEAAGGTPHAASPSASVSASSTKAETSGQSASPSRSATAASQAYAVLRIPRIGLTAPVAEGTSKTKVLNHGYVGHYPRTAQPGQAGNFAVAGHRNTHGEPFRHLDRLRVGDTVTVETATARFTYVVVKTLPQTSAHDGTVVAPVPYSSLHPGARLKGRGYYITLTTCTPEFTSRYRMVVWGRLTAAELR